MNISLLTKLVKLANNNPNDNEANSAARRVCKMIEDGEFKFVEDKVDIRIGNYDFSFRKPGSNDSTDDIFKDLLNIMRDVHRK